MLKSIYLLSLLLLFGSTVPGYAAPSAQANIPIDKVKAYIPSAAAVKSISNVVYELTDKAGAKVGVLLCSTPIADDVIGYADAVPVVVVLDMKDVVKGIFLLENYESPGYVKKVAQQGFFNRWNGKTVKEAYALKVDAVTGATLTSNAVKENMTIVLKEYLSRKK